MPKISELTAAATPVAGSAVTTIVSGGATLRTTVADLRNSPDPVILPQYQADPTPTSAGKLNLVARSSAGMDMPLWQRSDNVEKFTQSLFFNNIGFWSPSSGTGGGLNVGWNGSTTGTLSHPNIATGGRLAAMRRTRFTTDGTANGTAAGWRTSLTQTWRGNAAGLGGFFVAFRFGTNLQVEATRAFVGLTINLGTLSTDPSAATNAIGMAYDSTHLISAGWKFMTNDGTGTATITDLTGAPRDTTSVYELVMYAPPNGSSVTVRIINLTTGTVVMDNVAVTADLPSSTSFMVLSVQAQSAAVASAVSIELGRVYFESET